MTISREVLTRARNGVCAIGYLRVSLDEYAKAPQAPGFKIVGTGFVVAPGLVITNRHVIYNLIQSASQDGIRRDRFFLQFDSSSEDGTWVQSTLCPFGRIGASPPGEVDVGCISYNARGDDPKWMHEKPLQLGTELDITVGQPVACFGFAFGSNHLSRDEGGQTRLYRYGPILQQGYISAIAPFDNSAFVERILLDLRTSVGMSGAPVFDSATGSVIGIHEGGRDATTAFAIPLNQQTITTLAEAHTLGGPSNVALPMVTRRVRPNQDPDVPRV